VTPASFEAGVPGRLRLADDPLLWRPVVAEIRGTHRDSTVIVVGGVGSAGVGVAGAVGSGGLATVSGASIAFGHAGLDYNDHVVQDEKFYRPAEVDLLISDPSKARAVLGWEPAVTFKELVVMMVDADIKRLNHTK